MNTSIFRKFRVWLLAVHSAWIACLFLGLLWLAFGSDSSLLAEEFDCEEGSSSIPAAPLQLQVNEGTSKTYQLRLCEQPTEPVTITVKAAPINEVTTKPSELVFNRENYDITQTVTVTAVDDFLWKGKYFVILSHTVTTTDPVYKTKEGETVIVTVIDNERLAFPLISYMKPPTPTWRVVGNQGKSIDVVLVHNNALLAGHRRANNAGGGVYKGAVQCLADSPVSTEFSVRDVTFRANSTNGVAATFNDRIYSTSNNGDTWSATKPTTMNPFVYAVEFGKGDKDVYAGTDNGLYSSANSGMDWTHVDPTSGNSPKSIYSLNFDAAFPNSLWIGSYREGIWQVTLGNSKSFTNQNGGLPGDPESREVWEIVVDGTDLYIATSNGVYKRSGSDLWTAYGNLQGSQVFSLELVDNALGKAMFAGLSGKGVYRTPLTDNAAWTSVSADKLPTKTVRDLFYDVTALCNGLLAATDDGIWLYK